MICQNCHKNVATVVVIEILPRSAASEKGGAARSYQQQELCEICAQSKNLPHAPLEKKLLSDIWKLLQDSSRDAKPREDLTCPDCGMTREEFRRKGRMGCARDYELFTEDVQEVLERVHGATSHTGRLPGLAREQVERQRAICDLQRELASAIREEAYENAARIRDELRELGA